jgi:hypothetical protein
MAGMRAERLAYFAHLRDSAASVPRYTIPVENAEVEPDEDFNHD